MKNGDCDSFGSKSTIDGEEAGASDFEDASAFDDDDEEDMGDTGIAKADGFEDEEEEEEEDDVRVEEIKTGESTWVCRSCCFCRAMAVFGVAMTFFSKRVTRVLNTCDCGSS